MYADPDVDFGPEHPDLTVCEECRGFGVEHIDAPDYTGPAVCQMCAGHGHYTD